MLKFKFIVTSIIFFLSISMKLYSYDFSYKFDDQEFFLDFNENNEIGFK